ncbi:hypothetical protein C8R46DRAFT_140059 [Mycena filopes]|nr:hypothetical protein C8R46DRAFT_140059 [Mycena filopes]
MLNVIGSDDYSGPLFTSPPRPTEATLVGTAPLQGAQQETLEPVVMSPPPPPPPHPKRSGARPLNPRPGPPPPTVRSTRARSKELQLEPYVDDVEAIGRKNRQKAKKRVLEPLEERREEENFSRHSVSREPEGIAETQEVEAFLTAHSAISDGGNTVEDEIAMPPPRDTRRPAARQRSMETDDGQTDAALRPPRRVSFSPRPSAMDMLANLGGPRLSRPPESIAASSPRSRFAPDVFGSTSSRRGSSVQMPMIDLHNPFYTQSVGRGSPNGSETSGSFPMRRTRARTVKDEIKKMEKHTPYTPPAGTRAAHIVNSR